MERVGINGAARKLGITRAQIYKLVKQKKLTLHHDEEFKFPFFLVNDIEAYKRSYRKPGRKPKPVGTVSSNSDEAITDEESVTYDFFND